MGVQAKWEQLRCKFELSSGAALEVAHMQVLGFSVNNGEEQKHQTTAVSHPIRSDCGVSKSTFW